MLDIKVLFWYTFSTMKTVKLQVPMDKKVRDGLEIKAHSLGFDSAQAYIRVWAKAEVDGRKVNLDVDDWGVPSPKAVERLNKAAQEAKSGINVSEPLSTVKEAMAHLNSL